MSRLNALSAIWAERMPITEALGVHPRAAESQLLSVGMPLAPNRNHKGTVFAGSLSALATLTGWSALWLMAQDAGLNPHIILQDAQIRYLRPARGDVEAVCPVPESETRERLLAIYRRRGRVRTTIEVSVLDAEGVEVVVFEGRYVVHTLEMFGD